MYAGFWKRFLASLIDYIIIFCIQILFLIVWAGFELLLNLVGINQGTKEIILGVLGTPIMLALPWLYYAVLESSDRQATFGKRVLNIKVVDINNSKISFIKATVRFWSKFISGLILLIGYIMAAFTPKKQALHDMIANTYVIKRENYTA